MPRLPHGNRGDRAGGVPVARGRAAAASPCRTSPLVLPWRPRPRGLITRAAPAPTVAARHAWGGRVGELSRLKKPGDAGGGVADAPAAGGATRRSVEAPAALRGVGGERRRGAACWRRRLRGQISDERQGWWWERKRRQITTHSCRRSMTAAALPLKRHDGTITRGAGTSSNNEATMP